MTNKLKINRSIYLLCIISFFQITVSRGQDSTWFITKGLSGKTEVAWAIDVDSSGYIYWAVQEKDQWPYWYYNVLLSKISADKQEIWQSDSWGAEYNEIAFIAKEFDSKIYLAGRQGRIRSNP